MAIQAVPLLMGAARALGPKVAKYALGHTVAGKIMGVGGDAPQVAAPSSPTQMSQALSPYQFNQFGG